MLGENKHMIVDYTINARTLDVLTKISWNFDLHEDKMTGH